MNRLEHTAKRHGEKYHKIDYDAAAIADLFVAMFLEAHKRPPKEIVVDLDTTEDPLHGDREDRYFHGFYG